MLTSQIQKHQHCKRMEDQAGDFLKQLAVKLELVSNVDNATVNKMLKK